MQTDDKPYAVEKVLNTSTGEAVAIGTVNALDPEHARRLACDKGLIPALTSFRVREIDPADRVIGYREALRIAADFREPNDPNPEYERGQDELLADLFPIVGMACGDRAEAINAEIRQLNAQ